MGNYSERYSALKRRSLRSPLSAVTKENINEKQEVEEKQFFSVKWFNVFNLDCIDDSESEIKKKDIVSKLSGIVFNNPDERDSAIDCFINSLKADITHQGDRAYYSVISDKILMPQFSDFQSKEAYYSTLLHELAHWTGHPNRLDRFKKDSVLDRSTREYAFEELIAELASVYTSNHLGLSEVLLENHASYLNSWLSLLKNDEHAFFKAAKLAQKVNKYLIEKKENG